MAPRQARGSQSRQSSLPRVVKSQTCRTRGRSVVKTVERLSRLLRGWKACFQVAETPRLYRGLDERIRHPMRVLHLKQGKPGTATYRALRGLGTSEETAITVA
jgi:RNA-directed DNA polymerase